MSIDNITIESLISDLELDRNSPVPLHFQVSSAIVKYVHQRLVQPGTKLPAERNLATQLGISRITVRKAYEYLESQHIVESYKGRKGLFLTHDQAKKTRDSFGAYCGLCFLFRALCVDAVDQ